VQATVGGKKNIQRERERERDREREKELIEV
jgi:hypothetical protein